MADFSNWNFDDMTKDQLFALSYRATQRGVRKWVCALADVAQEQLAHYTPGNDWNEFATQCVNETVDSSVIYRDDIECILLATRAVDRHEGADPNDRHTTACLVMCDNVQRELESRGMWQPPCAPSNEAQPCEDDRTNHAPQLF